MHINKIIYLLSFIIIILIINKNKYNKNDYTFVSNNKDL